MAFISERHDPPVCNQMAVYYRSFEKSGIGISSKTKTKLHRFNVDTTCPTEARSVVMEELHNGSFHQANVGGCARREDSLTKLEQFELDYEQTEAEEDMHFSTYFIPSYYQPEEKKVESNFE